MFLVKVFTEGKKVVGKAFFPKERFVLSFYNFLPLLKSKIIFLLNYLIY